MTAAAFIGQEWLRRLANPINQAPYWLLAAALLKPRPMLILRVT